MRLVQRVKEGRGGFGFEAFCAGEALVNLLSQIWPLMLECVCLAVLFDI